MSTLVNLIGLMGFNTPTETINVPVQEEVFEQAIKSDDTVELLSVGIGEDRSFAAVSLHGKVYQVHLGAFYSVLPDILRGCKRFVCTEVQTKPFEYQPGRIAFLHIPRFKAL